METYIYEGVTYKNHTEVPFDKEDLKFSKKVAGWGKPDRLKDKRAPMIQHCYAMLLKKGLKSIPVLPDKRWLTYEDVRPLARWLEINEDANGYLEPLKVAKTIYLENN